VPSNASYIELRGKTYYIRMRVPSEFADVEPLPEINRSLKTRDLVEAQARCANAKAALYAEWRARRAGKAADTRAIFEESAELLKRWGMTFSSTADLAAGPLEALLPRIDLVADMDPTSPTVPAMLGAIDLPDASLHEMADRMHILKEDEIRAKNARQRREWCGNFRRAARDFTAQIGHRTVLTITHQDAIDYEAYWKRRAREGTSSNYANKQIRYVRQMIDAHFEDIRLPKNKRSNVFENMRVGKLAYESADQVRKKLPLPEKWIRQRLIQDRVLEGLNQQASDIAIIAAITGCRASEIYDLPPEDIHLDSEIPHITLRVVLEGPDRRELKSQASTRRVVLLGPALHAMRRHPQGFSAYRGRATFSGDVNGFLRANGLFPEVPPGVHGRYVFSGIRHSFEDRMLAAKIPNEERAYLMGHSIGRVRGRPVYGSDLDLQIRALLQEMVAIEGDGFSPRPIADLWDEIEKLLEERGHRVR
jgi:integrase